MYLAICNVGRNYWLKCQNSNPVNKFFFHDMQNYNPDLTRWNFLNKKIRSSIILLQFPLKKISKLLFAKKSEDVKLLFVRMWQVDGTDLLTSVFSGNLRYGAYLKVLNKMVYQIHRPNYLTEKQDTFT